MELVERLTDEQASVLNNILQGYNIFVTGRAGTGKSLTIRQARTQFAGTKNVRVIAPTGVAAVLIGGQTYHSFFGIGLGRGTRQQLVDDVRRKRDVCRRLQDNNLLLIFDEISMVSSAMMDTLDYIARSIRNRPREPFGGIQICAFGDFRQLPPIEDGNVPESGRFAFQSNVWPELFYSERGRVIQFTRIFRQLDMEFIDVLNEMRVCRISNGSLSKLASWSREIKTDDDLNIEPPHLYCKRINVERINAERLEALPGRATTYIAIDTGAPNFIARADTFFMAPKILEIKENAQVMLLCNITKHGLSNGSLGKVIKIQDGFPTVKFTNGLEFVIKHYDWDYFSNPTDAKPTLRRRQIPLMLSYASTIHKSQGLTLDRAIIDLDGYWEPAQPYVALSRVKSSRFVQVINFDPDRMKPSQVLDQFEETLNNQEKLYNMNKMREAINNIAEIRDDDGGGIAGDDE